MASPRLAGLALLALLPLASAASGGKEVPPAPRSAELGVRAGRVSLVQGEEVSILTRVSPRRTVAGAAYVEVGPLGEVEVAWSGSGSLRVRGPAALEWGPGDDVRVLRAERVELEVRRGRRELSLPGGWSLDVGRGAISVGENVAGDWLAEHRGGANVAIERGGQPIGQLKSGRRVLLTR